MKRLLAIAVLLTASVLAFATQSDAHVIEGAPTPSCTGVTASFTEFPSGTNTIVLHVGAQTSSESFTGATGTVSFLWLSLNVATSAGGSVVYSFTWSSDGGGSAGPFTYDATSCYVPPPTTTLPAPPPPTTTTPIPPPSPSTTTSSTTATSSPVSTTSPSTSATTVISSPPLPARKHSLESKPVPKAPPAPITPVVPEVTG